MLFRMNPNVLQLSFIFASALFMQSCLDGPQLFKQDGSADGAFLNLKLLQSEEGVFNIQVDANSVTNQNAVLPDGTQVQFPPGSLVLSSSVTIEYGSSLTSAELASSSGAGSFTAASSSVVISSSSSQDANNPFSLELPISSTSLRMLNSDDPYAKLVVIYKRNKVSDGELAEGVILRSDISIVNGKARFSTRFFGAFQLAYTQNTLQQAVERSSPTPILTKRAENKLAAVSWSVSAVQFDANNNGKVSFEAKNMTAPLKCMAYVDRDKKVSFDISKQTTSATEVQFALSEFNAYVKTDVFYISIHCNDATGRNSASDWSLFLNGTSGGSSSTFSLTTYSANTAASPHPNHQAITMGFSAMPSSATVPTGILLQNARSNWTPPFTVTANDTLKQLSFNPVLGNWPLYANFSFQLLSSVLKSSTGTSLDKNYNFNVHTADGVWQANPVLDFASNTSTKFLIDMNDAGKMAYIRSSSSSVFMNYYDGNAWSGENWIGSMNATNLGVHVDPTGVAYAAFFDSTSVDYYLYVFNPSNPTWVQRHWEVSGVSNVFRSSMIVKNDLSSFAYYLFVQSGVPDKLYACKLHPAMTSCASALDLGFPALGGSYDLRAKVNADGDLIVGYNVSSVTKARILKADGTLLPVFVAASNSTDSTSFDLGIFNRKSGESSPRALLAYSVYSVSTFFPRYSKFDGTNWSTEENLIGTGNTNYSTQTPAVEVSANGNAIAMVREPSSAALHIRMFSNYGDESVFQTLTSVNSAANWRTNAAINQDGVALMSFKKSTTEITHVLCTKGAASLTCNSWVDANALFPPQDTQLFNVGVDNAGNFISVFQSSSNASYLMQAKRIRYDANNQIPTSVDIDLGVSVASCEISLAVTPSGRAVAGCQGAARISISRFK